MLKVTYVLRMYTEFLSKYGRGGGKIHQPENEGVTNILLILIKILDSQEGGANSFQGGTNAPLCSLKETVVCIVPFNELHRMPESLQNHP